ncbi:MAG: HEAT repeat domain-containing protein [Gammaproteobacteria bacterium]
MAIPISQLSRLLNSDEPDYSKLARLGPKILPQLAQLVTSNDEYVAANAASLAGMIKHDKALAVLARASRSPSAPVRIAAAGALRRLNHPKVNGLIARLMNDGDKGVRKFAVKAVAGRSNPDLLAKIAEISRNDPSTVIRSIASRLMSRSTIV